MRILTFAIVALVATATLATAQPGQGGLFRAPQGQGFGQARDQAQVWQYRNRVETTARIQNRTRLHDSSNLPLYWNVPEGRRDQSRTHLQLQQFDGQQLRLRALSPDN